MYLQGKNGIFFYIIAELYLFLRLDISEPFYEKPVCAWWNIVLYSFPFIFDLSYGYC